MGFGLTVTSSETWGLSAWVVEEGFCQFSDQFKCLKSHLPNNLNRKSETFLNEALFFGSYWSKCISQCIIIWCLNMLKDREKPELLIYSIKWIYILSWLFPISFCCQYIVIFLSVIPGSERMAIYIAPLHCHGECVSSSHQRDTMQKHKK